MNFILNKFNLSENKVGSNQINLLLLHFICLYRLSTNVKSLSVKKNDTKLRKKRINMSISILLSARKINQLFRPWYHKGIRANNFFF